MHKALKIYGLLYDVSLLCMIQEDAGSTSLIVSTYCRFVPSIWAIIRWYSLWADRIARPDVHHCPGHSALSADVQYALGKLLEATLKHEAHWFIATSCGLVSSLHLAAAFSP
jgi:hypothetical protein